MNNSVVNKGAIQTSCNHICAMCEHQTIQRTMPNDVKSIKLVLHCHNPGVRLAVYGFTLSNSLGNYIP